MQAPRISDGQHPDPIVLRPITPDDVDAEVEMCQDPQVQRWTTVPVPYLREHAEYFVDKVVRGWAEGTSLELGIEALDDEGAPRLAGNVGLRLDGTGGAAVGFALAPWARGRGVMSRALRMMLTFGFRQLDLQVVHWQAHEGNWASRRVAWACGFRVEGLVRGLLTARGERHDGWVASIVRGEHMSPAQPWLSVPEILGERVVLRPWREDDVPRVVEACSDPLTQQWLPQLPAPYRVSDAQWYIRSREEQHAGAHGLYWCVADPLDDRCIGSIAPDGPGGPTRRGRDRLLGAPRRPRARRDDRGHPAGGPARGAPSGRRGPRPGPGHVARRRAQHRLQRRRPCRGHVAHRAGPSRRAAA